MTYQQESYPMFAILSTVIKHIQVEVYIIQSMFLYESQEKQLYR